MDLLANFQKILDSFIIPFQWNCDLKEYFLKSCGRTQTRVVYRHVNVLGRVFKKIKKTQGPSYYYALSILPCTRHILSNSTHEFMAVLLRPNHVHETRHSRTVLSDNHRIPLNCWFYPVGIVFFWQESRPWVQRAYFLSRHENHSDINLRARVPVYSCLLLSNALAYSWGKTSSGFHHRENFRRNLPFKGLRSACTYCFTALQTKRAKCNTNYEIYQCKKTDSLSFFR